MDRRNAALLCVAVGAILGAGELASAQDVPGGFVAERVIRGLDDPSNLAFSPDGRLFVTEHRKGRVRLATRSGNSWQLQTNPFFTFNVDYGNTGYAADGGLVNFAFDPNFASNKFMYVSLTTGNGFEVARLTAGSNTGTNMRIVFTAPPRMLNTGHPGGALAFGKDGKLYVALGESVGADKTKVQRLDGFAGKLLRINADGTIPTDNPFYAQAGGAYRAIYALGLRNPWSMMKDGAGDLYVNDVDVTHSSSKSSILKVEPAANWVHMGFGGIGNPRGAWAFGGNPVNDALGSVLVGGAYYTPSAFPVQYRNKFFLTLWGRESVQPGRVNVLDPATRTVSSFATGLVSVGGTAYATNTTRKSAGIAIGPDGSLYYLLTGFNIGANGEVWRIRPGDTPTYPLTVISGSGDGTFPAGAVTPVSAAPPPAGKVFDRWTGDVSALASATSANTTVTMPPAAVTVTATYRTGPVALYALTVNGGSGGGSYPPGTPVPITAGAPPSNSVFNRWTGDTATVANVTSAATTVTMPAANITVTATYSPTGAPPYGLPTRLPVGAYLGGKLPPSETGAIPARLSQTGAFSYVGSLTPHPALIPYEPLSPLWSDGTVKTRWLALPTGTQVTWSRKGEWTFPPGTVLVKHFELSTDENHPNLRRRLETRLLVVKGDGTAYGVTYRWRVDQSEADLLTGGLDEDLTISKAGGGTYVQRYHYPSRVECLGCHTPAANFVLGPSTKQLNGPFRYVSTGVVDNQLRTWNHVGLFHTALAENELPTYDALAKIGDATASLEKRVRSYLHSNCSHCHRPGGPGTVAGSGNWDGRYETPLANQNIINGPINHSLGISGERVVVPGDVGRSHLYRRMNTTDPSYKMPRIDRNRIDPAAVSTIAAWINSLGTGSSGSNLAPNPGFETDPDVDYFTHGSGTFAWATDARRSGSRSLKIVSAQPAGSLARWISRADSIPVTPGMTYSASAWLKLSNVVNHAQLRIVFLDASKQYLQGFGGPWTLTGTRDWTEHEVTAVAPAGAAFVRIEFCLFGPGTLWADDVVLSK